MIILRYVVFAAISTGVNLLLQYMSFVVYSGFLSLYIAMSVGTIGGLLIKYILDKKFIFYHVPIDKTDDRRKFIRYSLMGILTTFIFWFFEILFDHIGSENFNKYLGAVVGLSIGYTIKYFLDKKYVFIYEEYK